MEVANISKNVDFFNLTDRFYKGKIIREHLSNYSLDLYEDYQFLMAHYIKKSKTDKLILYVKDPKIHQTALPTLNFVIQDSQSWAHRLFQQKKYDFINVLKLPNQDIKKILEFVSSNFRNTYNEVLFLLPADNDDTGRLILETTNQLFTNQHTILYSLNHSFNIQGQTLPPLNSLIDQHLCFPHDQMQNEFINNGYTNMAHWLWNYHLNKNQNWLSL